MCYSGLDRFRMGPMEWLWRRWTYGTKTSILVKMGRTLALIMHLSMYIY
ncbi:DUF418 domain-containing protein [Larkinella arboricola]